MNFATQTLDPGVATMQTVNSAKPMTPAPRVTVGVPVYNGEKYLAHCLDSLLAQTYSDIEILICDNASTDRTEQICRDYAARDPRVRYLRNPVNIGLGGNFRRVLELARGEYFKAAAADDWCGPEFIARCVTALDGSPLSVLAYPRTRIVDDAGNPVNDCEDSLGVSSSSPSERFIHLMQTIRLCNALYGVTRTAVLRKTGWLAEYRTADSVLLAELSLFGKFQEIPEFLFFRRFHAGDTSKLSKSGEMDEYLKPGGTRRIGMLCVAWHRLLDFTLAVWRAPLSLRQKAKLSLWLLRFSFWQRRVLMSEIRLAMRVIWARS